MTVSRSLKTRSLPILTAAAMIATMIAVVAAPASAAVFSVTKTDDTADGTCDGDCSLREAINAANAAAGADTVTLPSGTYLLTIDGTDEDAGMAGDLDVTDDLTVTGAGAATTIVDASGLDEPVDRVFDLLNLDTTLTVAMSGLTIVNGNLEGSFNTTDDGGGIRVNGSDVSLSLTNSVVRDNSVDAGAAGGGIFLTGNDDTLTLMNTDVTMNFAQRGGGIKANGQGNIINVFGGSMVSGNEAGSGGGIFLLTDETTLTIDDSEVSHNEATGEGGSGDGGGIYIHHSRDGNTVILRNGSVLNENQADGDGGGLRVRENDAFTLDVLDSEVIGNTAYTGAGLYVGGGEGSTEAVATLDNSRVAFNRTDGDCGNGGGIYANAFPPEEGPEYGLTIENGSSVDRNFSACEGGGIYNGSQGSIGIFDSTVGHNVSWDEGGGIYNESGGLIEALDAAIELNSTLHGYGGGIYNEGRMWLYDETQISGNSAPEGHGGGIYNGGDVEGAFLFLGPESEEPDPEDVGPTVFANNADGAGGGIFNAPGSDLLMFRTAVLGNTAISGQYEGGVGSGGGGIYNHGWLWLDGSIVGFNRAANGPGGGLWNDGDGGPMDGAAEVDASLFLGNYASGDGGGIQNDSLVEGLGLHCSSVLGNSGWNGGGIGNTGQLSVTDCRPVALAIQRQMRRTVRAFQAQPDGPPVVEEIGEVLAGFDLFGESSVVGNVARNDGGGIWNTDAAEVFETTVDANSAPAGRGGGIFNSGRTGFTEWAYGTPGLFVDASTISDNFAQVSGGGLHTAVPGESGLRNSTVSGNFTNGEGGGIFEEDAGDSTVIFFTTVTGNSAPDFDGGGISIDDGDGSVGAVASIVGNNLGGDCSDTIESRGSNLDSDGSCFDSPEEFGDATADPELGPLADNGGLTETHLPDPGSPVVDGVGPIEGTCPEVDQRGEDRPVDGDGDEDDDCDIGSVELQEDELPPPPAPRVASAAIGVTTTADDPFVDD
ncbi:MAG TPA: choice-of-anchor Q domain-containing protein, partial [Actinomycetota bacterium]